MIDCSVLHGSDRRPRRFCLRLSRGRKIFMAHKMKCLLARAFLALVIALILPFSLTTARADVAAWLVMDVERGQVLESHNAGRLWAPASVTKMMTAYVVFQAMREGRISPQSTVIMSKKADAVPYGMKFKAGVSMTLDDAIKMMIVKSANDISHAIAEAISGTEPAFVDEMNAMSQRLGLTRSRWLNPHGLSEPGMITTARDLAVLTHRLWKDFPEYRFYFGIGAIKYGKKIHRSRNRLLGRYPGINGMKTGYVCDSGNNVVTTASRNGRTIGVITLGASGFLERAVVTKSLMDRGFRKRFGGKPLARFAATEGASLPTVSRYCSNWNKPEPSELLAKYTPKKGSSRNVLSLIEPGSRAERATSAVIGNDPEAADVSVASVLESVVGQDRGVVPVVVRTGVKSATVPVLMQVIPRPKPGTAGAVAPLSPAAQTRADAFQVAEGLRSRAGAVGLRREGPIALPGVSTGQGDLTAPQEVAAIGGTPVPGFPIPRAKPAR